MDANHPFSLSARWANRYCPAEFFVQPPPFDREYQSRPIEKIGAKQPAISRFASNGGSPDESRRES